MPESSLKYTPPERYVVLNVNKNKEFLFTNMQDAFNKYNEMLNNESKVTLLHRTPDYLHGKTINRVIDTNI